MENKKKGLLALSCATLLSLGLVAGFASLNNSNKMSTQFSQIEKTVQLNSFTQDTEGAHLAGNAVYFVDSSSDQWWCGEVGAKTAFYFFTEENSNKIEAFTPIVESTWDRNGKAVYESIVPEIPENLFGFTTWSKVIAIRINPSSTTGNIATWGDKYYNQSSDQTIGTGGNNTVFLSEYAESYSINAITAVERLEILSWAQGWSKPAADAGNLCDHDGNTDTVALASQWSLSGTAFGKLGEDVKYVFSHQEAEADTEEVHTTASVPDFAARYDWVYSRYHTSLGLTNWADR